MLEYSVYVHVLGIILVVGLSILLEQALSLVVHTMELPPLGVERYFYTYPAEATILLLGYAVYVVVVAELMGAYQIPAHVANGPSRIAAWASGRLNWLPRPSPTNPENPVWHDIFGESTAGHDERRPQVFTRMKSGDGYLGELATYPLVADDVSDKDFSIANAQYFPVAKPGQVFDLAQNDSGGGTVLLNTSNVESIQVYYVPFAQDSVAEPQSA